MGRREGGVMIDRFEERIWLYTGKVWFEGGDDTGNFGGVGVWVEDEHVDIEVDEGFQVARLSPAAAVQLAKAILTEYDTPTRGDV